MSIEHQIIFCTGNKGKFREITNEFNKYNLLTPSVNKKYHFTLVQKDIDIPEIQSTSNEEVVKYKLNWVLENVLSSVTQNNNSIIVEDTGLCIMDKIMNGFPGALIKFYLKHLGNEGICQQNTNAPTEAITYIGFWDGINQKDIYFKGTVTGYIAENPSGINGFGYDPCFVPLFLNDYKYFTDKKSELIIRERNINNLTFADLSDEQKAQTNMRTICTSKLCNYLLDY